MHEEDTYVGHVSIFIDKHLKRRETEGPSSAMLRSAEPYLELSNRDQQIRFIESVWNVESFRTKIGNGLPLLRFVLHSPKFSSLLRECMEEAKAKQQSFPNVLFAFVDLRKERRLTNRSIQIRL